MSIFKKAIWILLAALIGLGGLSWLVGSSMIFKRPSYTPPTTTVLPQLGKSEISLTANDTKTEILFGDLHVHTSYSIDAAIFGTPAVKGTQYTTPADACDFARYCSALDFWSSNDHAEGLSPWQWQTTKEAVRQCNEASAGGAPDLVAFLGWEWTQETSDGSPQSHYGHKNVILRDTAEDKVPRRPIGSGADSNFSILKKLAELPAVLRGLGLLLMSKFDLQGYGLLSDHLQSLSEYEDCGQGNVRDLPNDCLESADTPRDLFRKLDEWSFPAMVIPHGLAWGMLNPLGSDFALQMDQHNAKYQRLLEIFSGHGNSEIYRDINAQSALPPLCPAPKNGYTACCWRAGEIIQERCLANDGTDCDSRARRTRQLYLEASGPTHTTSFGRKVVPGAAPDDWGQCDQLTDAFQPAFNYRPNQSAQYLLTLGNSKNDFRPGFIGSSDNHTARAGSGYKEFARYYMTDSKDTGYRFELSNKNADQPVVPERPLFGDKEDVADAFFYTGGLVAVHSKGRDRNAIWDALQRRAVYGTSGPRIGLWFEMLDHNGDAHLMGSETSVSGNPTFRVSAVGSIKQKPGCPADVQAALGSDRIASLCRNECYNPSEEAYRIERIEIVRIFPRTSPDEKTADLIQDPWRVIDCSEQGSQCAAEIADDDFAGFGREAAYYARAIQEATAAVQGDPFRCEIDERGKCKATNYCVGVSKDEDCISPTQHRAWSSPIYVLPALTPTGQTALQ